MCAWEDPLGGFSFNEQHLNSQHLSVTNLAFLPLPSLQAITVTASKGQSLILPFTHARKVFTACQGPTGALSTAALQEPSDQGKNLNLSRNVKDAHLENTVNSLVWLPQQVCCHSEHVRCCWRVMSVAGGWRQGLELGL